MGLPSSSLRERSKARRRTSIQRAAMRLFAERGYDGATIADIADAAEVAPRTVSMYFPSKLDIAMSTSSDVAGRLTETFQAHPRLPFTDVVDIWLRGEAETDPELAALAAAMFDANPALRAVSTTRLAEVATLTRPALADQAGIAVDDPLFAIVEATVGAAITAYFTTALNSGSAEDMHDPFIRYLRAVIVAGSARRAHRRDHSSASSA